VLGAEGVAVASFTADWCPGCRTFAPTFNSVAEENANKAAFARVDVDKLGGVASQHGVRAIPTTIVFKNGEEVQRFTGPVGKSDLAASIS
jgi:thioredoxin 1